MKPSIMKEGQAMKIETLKRSHLKRNILIRVGIALIISAVILNFTRAKYRTTQSIPLVNGTINYDLADLNTVAVYIEEGDDYSKSDTIPSSGYTFNEERSYCTVNGEEDNSITVSYDANTQSLSVSPLTTQGTKCYLYFDEQQTLLKDVILANNEVNSSIPDFSQAATTDEGMYATTDNLGTSYYFRGAIENNYVQFAGYYWRINRINGDGSIRIIYDGTSAHANGESSSDRQISASAFNSSSNASYYVGYTYQASAQRPSSQNSGTASTIKGILDNWYSTNISGKELDDKVVSTPGFCNDRNTRSGDSWVSSGTTFYYASYERVVINKTPTLQCSNNIDLYTTKVGLITADEVMFAGGTTSSNNSYYLYTGQYYWTMSPYYFNEGMFVGAMTVIDTKGSFNAVFVDGGFDIFGEYVTMSVRPVINLAADVTISSGDGTSETPYVVS